MFQGSSRRASEAQQFCNFNIQQEPFGPAGLFCRSPI
jgi:hypothetical protein